MERSFYCRFNRWHRRADCEGSCRQEAIVLMHGRNSLRGEKVQEEIYRTTGNISLQFLQAELSSAKDIQKLADQIKESQDRLDVLINNAGTFQQERRLTEDGLEITFAVNYLAQFRLIHERLDLLKRSASGRYFEKCKPVQYSPISYDQELQEKLWRISTGSI